MTCNQTCPFCKIIRRDEACIQLYEDENTLAFMDKHPANDGHCLVIPKRHYETIFEVPPRNSLLWHERQSGSPLASSARFNLPGSVWCRRTVPVGDSR
jgi:hypothetical protein